MRLRVQHTTNLSSYLYAASPLPSGAAHANWWQSTVAARLVSRSYSLKRGSPVHISPQTNNHLIPPNPRLPRLLLQGLRNMATTSTSALSAAEQAALIESSKRAAAYQAVKDHMDFSFRNIGIGSGSTVVYVVEALRALGSDVTDKMSFFPTGDQSRELIKGAGFRLQYIQDLPDGASLDVAFDGADEVDAHLNLIKGGGACLFQEKLVATKAKKFVCVADFRKLSARLGESWKKGIPIEVVTSATGHVLSELKKLGSLNPQARSGLPGKAGSIVTDNGNSLIDAPFPPLALANDLKGEDGADGVWTVDGLADKLIKIVGVVETGLFYGVNGYQVQSGAQKPVAVYFGMADGSVEVRNAQ